MPRNKHGDWFTYTSNASQAWKEALCYWDSMNWHERETFGARYMQRARQAYRESVLLAFWVCVAPLEIGSCVPDEVATLLAEEWDLRGRSVR